MALESEKAINEDFNLSHPQPTSVKELAEMVWKKVHNTPLKLKYCDSFEYDVQYRSPDTSKAEKILGFKTEIDLDQSVEEVINWMKGNLT